MGTPSLAKELSSAEVARIMALFEKGAAEHAKFARLGEHDVRTQSDRDAFDRTVSDASHKLAIDVVDLVGAPSGRWDLTRNILLRHRLHQEFLLQSEFISHAFVKPFGYAGDHALMELIYSNEQRGGSIYAASKNSVYQNLPAAEAVRSRAFGLERVLRELPEDARVLSLACGPAREVQRIDADGGLSFDIDLLDHDLRSLEFARSKIRSRRARYIVANAFDMIKGQTVFPTVLARDDTGSSAAAFHPVPRGYDLVYSAGLYDYVRAYPLNASRGVLGLTRLLFDLVKPGGRLVVGNFTMPGGQNRHRLSHRLMMEAYSDWKLIYRSTEEIAAFADSLPRGSFTAEILDEAIASPVQDNSVIGHLVITRTA